MTSYTGIQLSRRFKEWIELIQPLPVKYGYPRGIKHGDDFITYRDIGSTPDLAVGTGIMSERRTFLVTVQTKTAEDNLLYSSIVKFATRGSYVTLISEDMRKDVTVEDGWINSIMVSVFNAIDPGAVQPDYTAEEVRAILQDVADNYMSSTSTYRQTDGDSALDSFVVPELPKPIYTYDEMLELKQEYLDRLI